MPNKQKHIFATNLKTLLAEHNLSQVDVATAIGTSPQTFNTWTQEIALPRMVKIQALADYFSVKKSYFLEDHSTTNTDDRKSAFSVTEIERIMLTKYRSLDDYGVEMVDFTLEKQYERCKAEKTSRINKFPSEDYLTPVAAHERTDIKVTQEMIDHDNDIMDDEDF